MSVLVKSKTVLKNNMILKIKYPGKLATVIKAKGRGPIVGFMMAFAKNKHFIEFLVQIYIT